MNAANHFGYTPIHLAALVGNAAGLDRSGQDFSTRVVPLFKSLFKSPDDAVSERKPLGQVFERFRNGKPMSIFVRPMKKKSRQFRLLL